MNQLISDIIAVIYSGLLIFGGGYGIKEVHDFVRQEAVKKISTGLSSSEALEMP